MTGFTGLTQKDGVTPMDDAQGRLGVSLMGSAAVQLHSSSGNVANAAAVATLAAAAGLTNYLSGFEITGSGATGALVVNVTVTGLLGGTQTHVFTAPAGAAVGATPLVVRYNPPIPASDVNTAIVVTLPALGAGNTNACVVAHGFRQ